MLHQVSRCLLGMTLLLTTATAQAQSLRVGVFTTDASPPIGSPMAYDPTKAIQEPLSLKGIVILGTEQPIVLCAVDWIGIGNDGQTVFREALAKAVDTSVVRVTVHTLHQHDAPRCDFSAEEIMTAEGKPGVAFDPGFARDVARRAGLAAAEAVKTAQPVTHLGVGRGTVEKVASNRRILGSDGKVQFTRYTATRDPKIRAFPAGTIDPELKMVSFWNGDQPIVALTYYATHPQSYYRTGLANPDFPGMARNAREQTTGIPHVHFNGAGGNIGAGKWNDGSHENRQVLADRVAAGMKQAWESTTREPLDARAVSWSHVPVVLPVAPHLDEQALVATIKDTTQKPETRWYAAKDLSWLRRCQAGDPIQVSCLSVRNVRILHMPGELFVEYQLNAQKLRPDLFVPMAAYGDYAPGYIGTEIAYGQGGYETSQRASKVAPQVEQALMKAVTELLEHPSESGD